VGCAECFDMLLPLADSAALAGGLQGAVRTGDIPRIKMLLDRGKHLSFPSNFRRCTTFAAFRQGIVTNVLNPKVALFFLAFLPQFIDPASNIKAIAFLLLGFTFVTTGTIWCLILACFAATLSERLRSNEKVGQWLNRTVGALFVYLGARLATAK